jgi:aldose 1-epimerase
MNFGRTTNGLATQLFELRNDNGISVFITNYGGRITQIWTPDQNGRLGNIVLGYDNLRQYEADTAYFGALIGRNANRIGNSAFNLDGTTYQLAANDGKHNLHGGACGFDKRIWEVLSANSGSLVLRLDSAHMEEGFPGNLTVIVGYHLNAHNELAIIYNAESDRRTPCNLTNHTYFNLAGAGRTNILNHRIKLSAHQYLASDQELIPTEIRAVDDTPMDMRCFRSLESVISQVEGGVDHAFIHDRGYSVVAQAYDPLSQRRLTMSSSERSVQLYTGNHLDGTIHGNGGTYHKHAGFCLEAQHYPNAVNRPDFPTCILEPGDKYGQTTVYKFDLAG